MLIRPYRPAECAGLAALFYETVHSVNARDYTPVQLDAWANGHVDLTTWNQSFLEHCTLVAVEGDTIIGFGDMDSSGYLDRLYVRKDFQRRGVATALCDTLEQTVNARVFTTHASITARPFFEHRGYRVVKEQQVLRSGIALTNYAMEKRK